MSSAPSSPFMSPAPPVYCAICAAPCLLPRASIQPPDPTVQIGLVGSDTLDAVIDPIAPESSSGSSGEGPTWVHAWHYLRVSCGILNPSAVSISSPPLASSLRASSIDPTRRTVSIHHYCLEAAIRTIRKSTFASGYTHEETMMLGWSLPKWTGWGPWGPNPPDHGSTHVVGWPSGFWTGTPSQRSRWQRGKEGSHLLAIDSLCPADVGVPTPRAPIQAQRPAQGSPFLKLPDHIHIQILLQLLDNPDLAPHDPSRSKSGQVQAYKLLRADGINDFLSLLKTCWDLRSLALPQHLWERFIRNSVSAWRLDVLRRWRANPTGVGSASQLSLALDEHFVNPIERAIANIPRNKTSVLTSACAREEGDGDDVVAGYTARDVWTWWMYDERWRSRRRVWHCVVHACATARDADWW